SLGSMMCVWSGTLLLIKQF
ncbi:type III secretion apparatus protein, YscD/HrpQ family, partial [Vibrio parahaemolyticus V-223/04]